MIRVDSRLAGLALVLLLLWSRPLTAQTEPFAGLTVTPYGGQAFDLSTGMTTLDDGGEVVDQTTGVVLTAPFIQLQEGVFIEAEGAEVAGEFGTFRAVSLTIDLATSSLVAEGELELVRGQLTIRSERLDYFATDEVVRFLGQVAGEGPQFTAAGVVLDALSGTVLLMGPYTFQDGLFTLQSRQPGSFLQLVPYELDGVVSYDAASEVDVEVLARLEPFLP